MVSRELTSDPADPQRAPCAHAPEAVAAVERRPIFSAEIRIALARPAVDAGTVPDSSTALRTYINAFAA